MTQMRSRFIGVSLPLLAMFLCGLFEAIFAEIFIARFVMG